MTRHLFTRLWQSILALLILATIVFILARMTGNPVNLLLPLNATMADRQRLTEELGLDKSYPEQYVTFMGGLLRGDLGDSLRYKRPVTELYFERLPNTLALVASGVIFAVIVAIPLGVLAGSKRGSWIDQMSRVIAVIGISAPSFWLGLILMDIFAVRIGILPAARMGGFTHYILPAFTLGLFALAGMTRLLRSSMVEALDSEYVKLAQIKGVSPNMVLWRHCLRNALVPVLTFLGMFIGIVMGGTIVIEAVFAWPGVGLLAYEGITQRDYPLVQCVILMTGVIIVALNFITDVLYSYVDPRIKIT